MFPTGAMTLETSGRVITLGELQRLAACDAPDLPDAVLAYLDQPDPAWQGVTVQGERTWEEFLAALHTLRWRPRAERKAATLLEWKQYLAQRNPPAPERFGLASLITTLYDRGTDASRASLVQIALRAPLRYGLWGGLKAVYKRAEAALDAQVWAALAWRFDVSLGASPRAQHGCDVGVGTLRYLKRRAWRFLRELGRAVPALYPQFAAEVLRHYGPDTRWRMVWVAHHIWAHQTGKYTARAFTFSSPPSDLVKHRAFADAWRRTPDPLLTLLERAQAELPARFAIQSLRKDFAATLRALPPAWLARLATSPVDAVHEFLVELLESSPDLHQSKLRALGLHTAVLSLLQSPSRKARAYAVAYARAHAADLSVEALLAALQSDYPEARQPAAEIVRGRGARVLGVQLLGRLLALTETAKWAAEQLDAQFDRSEIAREFLADMVFGVNAQRAWAFKHLAGKYQPGELPAAFWRDLLDDPRAAESAHAAAALVQNLGKYPVGDIGAGWLLDALLRPRLGAAVAQWLGKADALPGLDLERVKGMVFHPALRPVALQLLGNRKLVSVQALGVGWLLALARRPDPSLHTFAHQTLLARVRPEDFAEAAPGEDAAAVKARGVARLFTMATGPKEPDAVRAFAQTYLRCHHPALGASQPESKQHGVKPLVSAAEYSAARLWPALDDARPDVRRFAVTITRAELRAWGYHTRVYELAEREPKEVRNVAYDALLKAGEKGADKACTLAVAELDPARVMALTESRRKSTREVGVELIRRHYGRLGGPERLGWLMASADREVRLFAVRLLWERHRPRVLPEGWAPRGKQLAAALDGARFADVEALRDFLRRVLFALPPGRMERRDDKHPRRHVPASEAKRNAVEVVRDLGADDPAFAQVVAPVLGEFVGSMARGEWQSCLSALVHLRRAHPTLDLGAL